MFVFVLYAVMVWYLAARGRRRWEGFAAVFGGLGGLLLLAWLHVQLYHWTDGAIGLPMLQILLYPYTLLVFGMGLFTACLPRAPMAGHCALCRYDLSGLVAETTICPECGLDLTMPVEAALDLHRAARAPQEAASDGGRSAVATLGALATSSRERARERASLRSPATAEPRALLRSEER